MVLANLFTELKILVQLHVFQR